MKKQIFILVILVLATFANGNKSYGQAVKGSDPRGIGCVDDAMHPMAGKKYVYKAASTQAGNYTFWSTKNPNFITTTALGVTSTNMAATKLNSNTTTPIGTDLLTTSGNYATSAPTDNVEITWSDAVLNNTTVASPTFVAVKKDGTCVNNFNAWSINPIKAFTVDIKNMDHALFTSWPYDNISESQCFDQVRGAKFVTNKIEYDFGIQTLYFEVIAANFSVSYTPTFTITGLGAGQTATVEWDAFSNFPSPTTAVALTNGTPVASATVVSTSVTNTTAGVSIYVKVTIKNNAFQGIASIPITLAVDGQNSVGDWDIINSTVADPTTLTCTVAIGADQTDVATQILAPRPNITPAITTPITTFVTGNQTN